MSAESPPDRMYAELNHGVVDRVVRRLAATGLAAGDRDADPATCCRDAEKIRDFLNMEIPNVRGDGPLADSFKRMRRSTRDFVRAAGPDQTTFREDPAHFEACLAAMRLTLGEELTALSDDFGVDTRG